MTNTLPENVNEAVAAACEFTILRSIFRKHEIHVREWRNARYPWRPATDDAAAMFALFAWCRKNKSAWQLNGIPSSGDYVQCQVWNHQGVNHCATEDSLAEAVCAMILAAEEARTQ